MLFYLAYRVGGLPVNYVTKVNILYNMYPKTSCDSGCLAGIQLLREDRIDLARCMRGRVYLN